MKKIYEICIYETLFFQEKGYQRMPALSTGMCFSFCTSYFTLFILRL